ncbi:2,3-dehydroadipyl-CoA hydratase [Zhongshania aliphaticivorans]|uniref:2,3-dehydroadipyl-CoA hydratase n=1 Tax=Zhongshania aliphaticivorans TaxID=1470434 RepID=A0A5S9N631_9GAMM|nr:enoyl-CoA hydratase/isomerase family protein [Zhongshania aliphaticivorans]CAA0081671.1 2,3-dehydroadipyl-CoA hydratase [Zhongshania aliphaticivorans]CAA0084734.1 2,3-dehydroadipyl-CoA hydratase [Zhongshania aliphaticivorans]
MTAYETITYSVSNRVATISLNRPKAMNAISQQMRLELKQAVDTAESADDVRVVVLRAEGRGFSSGTDLTEGLAGFDTIDDQIQEEYKPVLMAIANSSKPYIASVHGAAAGIGAAFALSCDLAIMGEGAFVYLAFAGIALVPDGGIAHHLVNAMGYRKAYQAFVEAARIPAEECLQYGLVNKVVADDKLAEETQAWAERLAEGSPLAQKYGKQIMRGVHTSSFEETLDMESKKQVLCSTSQDSATAIGAFFAKTKPTFIGA